MMANRATFGCGQMRGRPPFFYPNMQDDTALLSSDEFTALEERLESQFLHSQHDLGCQLQTWGGDTIDQSMTEPSVIDPILFGQGYDRAMQYGQPTYDPNPMARYVNEQQRPLFSIPKKHSLPPRSNHTGTPVGPLPYTAQGRVASPAPSFGSYGLTSSSSAAVSPPAEYDIYPDSAPKASFAHLQDDFAGFGGSGQFTQGTMATYWNKAQGQQQTYSLPQQSHGQNCVNLSQVQGFVDHQEENAFVDSDGYTLEAHGYSPHMNDSSTIEVAPMRQDSYYVDEGLGSSIHGHPTPASTVHSPLDNDHNSAMGSDEDGDAESENDSSTPAGPDPADDDEYSPVAKSRRSTRARRTTTKSDTILTPRNTNRNPRVTKSSKTNISTSRPPRTSSNTDSNKGPHVCNEQPCNVTIPFSSRAALHKHIAENHIRAFTCTFSFAGCTSSFGSKNEWKRHVQTQHLNLVAWICAEDTKCRALNDGHGAEFNRKDLFAQHLRRMHAPQGVEKPVKGKSLSAQPINEGWEQRLRDLQDANMVVKRREPEKLSCPVQGCTAVFEGGKNVWDQLMEHVGKHVERLKRSGQVVNLAPGGSREIRGDKDPFLVAWALREKVIERNVGGGYRLVVANIPGTAPRTGRGPRGATAGQAPPTSMSLARGSTGARSSARRVPPSHQTYVSDDDEDEDVDAEGEDE